LAFSTNFISKNSMSLFSSLFKAGAPAVRRVAPAEAAQLVAGGHAVLIDVREPDEWADGVASPAELLALSDLTGPRQTWKPFLEKNRDRELILYCRSGGRSGRAAQLLASEGFRTANAGGFSDWARAGLPVRKLQGDR
jgi:rhodanese-related sulfurtransferase